MVYNQLIDSLNKKQSISLDLVVKYTIFHKISNFKLLNTKSPSQIVKYLWSPKVFFVKLKRTYVLNDTILLKISNVKLPNTK